jgi:hypothetical protein
MKKRATIPMAGVLASVGFVLVSGAHPQSTASPIPRIELKAGDTVSIANSGFSLAAFGPVRCDSQGNVYLRPVSDKMNMLLSPILRISADGQHMTKFDIANAPEIKDSNVYNINDFAVRKDGTVVILAGAATKENGLFVAVAEIDPEDKTTSVIRIDSELRPSQIVPLPSGMFLLSGVLRSSQGSGKQIRQSTKPFTGIFDSRGRLVREVELPGDVKIPDVDSSNPEKADLSNVQAVYLSHFVAADDGTIYMLRNGSSPNIYVLSSYGDVIRSFPFAPPTADAIASSMFYSAGRLAFGFSLTDLKDFPTDLVVRVIDAEDGHILWDYVPGKDVAGLPACYNGEGFALLSGDRQGLALLKVSAH